MLEGIKNLFRREEIKEKSNLDKAKFHAILALSYWIKSENHEYIGFVSEDGNYCIALGIKEENKKEQLER